MEERKKKPIGYGKRVVVSALAQDSRLGGAILEINKGKRTDLRFHMQNSKIIYLMSGQLRVWVLKEGQMTSLTVDPGASFFVRNGVMHQLEALENSIAVEFVSNVELYDDGDEHIVALGTAPEKIPEVVKEGEFATMSPEDVAKATAPATPARKKQTKKTQAKKTTTKRKRR